MSRYDVEHQVTDTNVIALVACPACGAARGSRCAPGTRVHWQRREKARRTPPSRDLIDACRAGIAWDRHEHERLRTWFRTWGKTLFDP